MEEEAENDFNGCAGVLVGNGAMYATTDLDGVGILKIDVFIAGSESTRHIYRGQEKLEYEEGQDFQSFPSNHQTYRKRL